MLWITRIKAWLFERVLSLCRCLSLSLSVSVSLSLSLSLSSVSDGCVSLSLSSVSLSLSVSLFCVSFYVCGYVRERKSLNGCSSWPQGARARLNVWVSVFLASSKQNKHQNANLHAHQKQCFNMKTDGTVTQFNLRMLTVTSVARCVYNISICNSKTKCVLFKEEKKVIFMQ